MRYSLVLSVLATVATCHQSTSQDELNTGPVDISEIATARVVYECTNGVDVSARYNTDRTDNSSVKLTIADKKYELSLIEAASGARYVTMRGSSPDTYLVWWTKDGAATLLEGLSHDGSSVTEAKMVATCNEKINV